MAKKAKKTGAAAIATTEEHEFKMHDRLLIDVIRRQAGTLHKAVLEGVMNACDAGATDIYIKLTGDKLVIGDNGSGITERQILVKYWSTFGQPPDETEKKTYGYFRMGRGQLFAFGKNVWETGPFKMSVDIVNNGLKYDLDEYPLPQTHGCHIEIDLYNKLLPTDIAQMQRELEVSVKYVPAKVKFNGKEITMPTDKVKWEHVTDEAYVKLRDSGNLFVYNLGVLVCSHPGHVFGCGGEVVSRQQLKVNFARNEVMSDCPVWKKIRPLVNKKAKERVNKQPAMTDAARQHIADLIIAGDESVNGFKSRILTDVTGRHWSLSQLRPNEWADTITVAPTGDRRGDKLMQHKLGFVFSQETLDRFRVETTEALLELLKPYDEASTIERFQPIDFSKLSAGINERYDLIPEREWTAVEQAIIETCRYNLSHLLHHLAQLEKDPELTFETHRLLKVGLSSCADGWTDGDSYIAISREYIARTGCALGAWASYACLLIHEFCHDESDQGSHIHSPEFYEKYHNWSMRAVQDFAEACVSDFPKIAERASKQLTKRELVNENRVVRQQRAAETVQKADQKVAAKTSAK